MYIEDVATKTVHYIYDVDDNWHHVMKVEKIDDVTSGEAYLRLVRAIGACPPESVGGFPDYADFLAAIAVAKHEQHDLILKWYWEKLDPEDAEIGSILDNFEGHANQKQFQNSPDK
jgi:hypothetical protein